MDGVLLVECLRKSVGVWGVQVGFLFSWLLACLVCWLGWVEWLVGRLVCWLDQVVTHISALVGVTHLCFGC